MKQKYLFLYLNTGGGHISSAKALVKYMESTHPEEIEPILVNGFENVSNFAKKMVEDGYRFTQNKAIWYFEMLYYFNKQTLWAKWNNYLISKFCKKALEKKILEEKPAKIIVMHFFLNKPIVEIVKEHKLNIPVITVITDPYTASPIWYQTKEQQFVVFSERVKTDMLKAKVSPDNIQVFPFFLNEKYQKKMTEIDISTFRGKLNISAQRKLILVIGGGEGIPHGEAILKQLLDSKPNYEIAVVCGKNKEFQNNAEKIKNDYSASNLHVFGFVEFVYELMNLSEIVITKGGPSTLMEILMLEKVPVINSYIWEQEKGNMEFVRDNGMGLYIPDVKKIPEVIQKLLTDSTYYNTFLEKIKNSKIENGTKQVGEYIFNLKI